MKENNSWESSKDCNGVLRKALLIQDCKIEKRHEREKPLLFKLQMKGKNGILLFVEFLKGLLEDRK